MAHDSDVIITTDLDISEVREKARELRTEIRDALGKIDMSKASASFKIMAEKLQDNVNKSRELSRQIQDLQDNPIKSKKLVETDEFKQQIKDVDKLRKALSTLEERYSLYKQKNKITEEDVRTTLNKYNDPNYKGALTEKDKSIFTYATKIEEASRALAEANMELTRMKDNGEQFREVIETTDADIERLAQKMDSLNNRMRSAQIRLENSKEYQAALGTAENLGEEGDAAKDATQSLNELDKQKKKTTKSNAELGNEAEKTGADLESEHRAGINLSNAFHTLRKALSAAWGGMRKVGGAVKGIVNHFRGANKEAQYSAGSFKQLFKFALKYGLGLRSIFILYKRIRSAGVEAYKGLAGQFTELQEELDQLKVAFFQLKNSIATMAQPILSYLVPAIKTVMGWLVSLMNTLANFFAILTGQKYIYKATKNNNALAKSISGAGKAAKEANEDIAEYDNLILIQQDKDNGGGGGGGDLDQYAGAWEKVAAENDFAQQLKDAVNRGDWEGVGDLFAQKLNGVVNRVDDWINNVLRPEGKKWAERIGKILNGLTAGFDAKKFGQTVADAVNAIFDIANTFLTTYNFLQLGEKVGTSISNFFKKVDLNLVGTTLANKLNATIDFLTGLLKKLEFKDIGNKIGQGLKKFLETIKFEDVAADLSQLANGILEALSGFLRGSELGKTVGTAISNFLNGINFADLAENLSELASNILSALADLLENFPWREVGEAIADFLTHIDWMQLLVQLGEVALNLIKGLAEAIIGLISNPEALLKIAEALALFFGAKFIWGKVTGAIATGIGGALSGGTAAAVGSAGGWLGRVFGTDLGAGAAGWAGSIAQGLIGGLATFQGVGSIAGSIGSVLANVFSQDDALIAEYQKFSKNAIGYTVGAFKEAVTAAKEYSETTGKSTLANAWSMMWGGEDVTEIAKQKTAEALRASQKELERAKLGFSKEKGGIGREVTDIEWLAHEWGDTVDQMLQTTDDAWFGMGAKMREFGEMLAPAVEEGRKSLGLFAQDLESFKTDSNHYAEIAKQNAGIYESTTKQAEEASNHYVEIAKQNSGYYDKIQKEMEASSNHYVAIAKANAGIVETETKESLTEIEKSSTESFITLTKEADNAGFELVTTFTDANAEVIHSFDGTEQYFTTVAEGVKEPFSDMGDFFTKTFGTAWTDTVKIFQSNSPEFTTIQDKISGTFTGAINSMIGGINNTLVKPFSAFNNVMAKLKEMSVGGSKLFAGLPSAVNIPTIPKLAQGAVLPPNQPFLAMVGDQTSGTNIETPLETMVEAFRQALSERNNNQTIVLTLNGNQIAQAVWNEESKRYKQTGVRYRQA